MQALPVLTAVSEQTKAMAHVDLTSNDNEDSNSQGVKKVERVKKTTDVINHQMISSFRYEDLMRACEKDWKHWLQQEKQKVTK